MKKKDQGHSATTSPSTHITQIKKGSIIQGNIKSQQSIRVDGHVTGDLISEERIIVGEGGHIGGNLMGSDITVDGFVNGDVLSKGSLSISGNAKIFGKIYSKDLAIERGAELNGKVNVGRDVEIPDMSSSAPSRVISDRSSRMSKTSDESKDNYGNVAW